DPASPFNQEPGGGGARIDLGAYGNTDQATTPPGAYVRVDYPNFYTDLVYNTGHAIAWHTYGVSGNVRIELYDSTNTTLLASIGTVAASAGSFTGTPQNSGITPDSTTRYRIRITSVTNPAVNAASREPFAVPPDSPIYYVNDASTVGDEYTTAVGNNRNTG